MATTTLLKIPITETINDITKDIDIVSPLGIVRLLRQSDAQLFAGYADVPGVYDEPILKVIDEISTAASKILQDTENNAIVMSGSGTSGRIAYLCARSFNIVLKSLGKKPCFYYLISGGDKSIIMSMELPEDDPILGASELEQITKEKKQVLCIGITCGLSAPYAFGQIDYSMKYQNFTTVLMGFNPIEFSRNVSIEKWNKTCFQVTQELSKLGKETNRHFIVNPAVGPEPITGSSRMKGGSMTKILLDVIFSKAISSSFLNKQLNTVTILNEFERTYRISYLHAENIAKIISFGGESLKSGGHIYYVGSDSAGILGFIDASEMFDTYGEDYYSVRGFVEGGWSTLSNSEGDLSSVNKLFRLSTADFEKEIIEELTPNDTVIFPFIVNQGSSFPSSNNSIVKIASRVKLERKCHTAIIVVGIFEEKEIPSGIFDVVIKVQLPTIETFYVSFPPGVTGPTPFAEFSLKLIFNAITTGSCIQKGRVFGNMMINLNVSNNKLYFRTIGIIQKLIGVDENTAKFSLLKAIYDKDSIDETILNLPISHHIEVATPKPLILPISMLLASGKFTIESAKSALAQEPVVRNIIKNISQTQK